MRAGLPGFLVVLGLFLGTPAATALAAPGLPHDPTPYAPNAITANYHVRVLPGLDAFDVVVKLAVREAQVHGHEGLPAQAIRDGGPAARANFEAAVIQRITNELKAAFPEATVGPVRLHVDYQQSNHDDNLFEPPILAEGSSRVPLTPLAMGITSTRATSAAELARAFLYSGGTIAFDRPLTVPAGFDARIVVEVPDFLSLTAGQASSTRLVFARDNSLGAGSQPLRLRFQVTLDPVHLPPEVDLGARIRATFVANDVTPLWLQMVPFTSGRYEADLDLWIELYALPLSEFTTSPLPARVALTNVSADLLRLAIRERLLFAEDVHAHFAGLITTSLRDGFGPAAEIEMDEATFSKSLREPIGGADGETVAPLLIHAKALLPLKADKMVLGSAMARAVGMITGIPAKFPVDNDGSWAMDLTLLYPEDIQITASDSLGRLEPVQRDGREGFTLSLAPGEETRVHVSGQPRFHLGLFALGALEIGALVACGWWLTLKLQALRQSRSAPWAPRP